MSSYRFPQVFIDLPDDANPGLEVSLEAEDAHHVASVLRLKAGDKVQIVDPKSESCFIAELGTVNKSTVNGTLQEQVELPTSQSPVKSLSIANLKGKNTTVVIEKAVELGVRNIIVFEASRSIKKLDKDSQKNLVRLQKIAKSAAAQSNKNYLPEICLCSSLKEAVNKVKTLSQPEDLLLCASLEDETTAISSEEEQKQYCHIIVGPEGDFTDEEYSLLSQEGWHHVSLGPFVLRSETAAIAAVAMASAILGYRATEK